MKHLTPTSDQLFFTKHDPLDPRLGELFKPCSLELLPSNTVVLWGYPDDEGIRLNAGRPGSAKGPLQIRNFLYRMTPDVFSSKSAIQAFDIGNLEPDALPLPQRHDYARKLAKMAAQKDCFAISIGGGHDYGFPDAAGFCEHWLSAGKTPLVINFDAHLDVRPLDKGFTSGTPFFRLLTEFGQKIDFVEFGIQGQCNSGAHLDWALKHGAKVVSAKDICHLGLKYLLELHLSCHHGQPCFISLDMDVFSSVSAPGCSQSWETGISASEFILNLPSLIKIAAPKALGIYEVSPELDLDNRTSKLAAQIIHQMLYL